MYTIMCMQVYVYVSIGNTSIRDESRAHVSIVVLFDELPWAELIIGFLGGCSHKRVIRGFCSL